MNQIEIEIDGIKLLAEQGMTVMDAAENHNIYIPHICHHPDLEDIGGCGLCVVKVKGEDEPQKACMTKVFEGMIINTKSEDLDVIRRLSMELMLANHVDDCTTCPKYLKCELQSLIQYLSVSTSRLRRTLNTTPVDTSNPLIVRDLNRCVACGRCVRVCRDVRGVGILDYQKNEFDRVSVGVINDRSLLDADCKFCGACVEVCPTGALQDKNGLFKEGNREEVLIPCMTECPAHINIPKYVRLIKEGNFAEAAAVVREKAPFPKSLGLVCVRFCEASCRRKDINGSVSIRDLKRFAAEQDDYLWRNKAYQKIMSGKKVAIIGSGPAGLTSAYFLAKSGHKVDVYEKLSIPGGMLSAGIPEYRLPKVIVEEEIKIIKNTGVNIYTDTKINSLSELIDKEYDALLIAVGTDVGIRMALPGAIHKDVHVNIDFLRRDLYNLDIELKESAIVLGGGNVAFDCARTLKRVGVNKVSLICLESRDRMPADIEEIEEALEEGIEIYNRRTFNEIITNKTSVEGILCQNANDFHFSKEGKLQLDIVENSDHIIEGQMVIFAVGQKADTEGFNDLDLDRKGLILIDEQCMTNQKGVFAVGDAVKGTSSVIEAIAHGRKAAKSIDLFLGGDGVIDEILSEEETLDGYIGKEVGFAEIKRHECSCMSPDERKRNFKLVTKGFDATVAQQEASRCLQCNLRPKLTKQKFWTEYERR